MLNFNLYIRHSKSLTAIISNEIVQLLQHTNKIMLSKGSQSW